MVFFLPSFSSINMVTMMPNDKGKYLNINHDKFFMCYAIYQFILSFSTLISTFTYHILSYEIN